MRRSFLVAFLAALALSEGSRFSRVDAAPADCTSSPVLQIVGFETITVGATAIGFSATVYAPSGQIPADFALVTVETEPLRYRDDGVNPTNSVGHLVSDGQTIQVCGNTSIRIVRFIEAVEAANSVITVSYYRGGV